MEYTIEWGWVNAQAPYHNIQQNGTFAQILDVACAIAKCRHIAYVYIYKGTREGTRITAIWPSE